VDVVNFRKDTKPTKNKPNYLKQTGMISPFAKQKRSTSAGSNFEV
jgi:hypothetical protein